MSERIVITGANVCTPAGLKADSTVVIRSGRIESIGPMASGASERVIAAEGLYLLPGFADTHTHGMALFEFTAGWFDPASGKMTADEDTWQRGLPHFARHLAATGVTRAWPSLWAAPIPNLQRALGELKDYLAGGSNGTDGAILVGANLEGSFISPHAAGAQNPDHVLACEPTLFDRIDEAGVIRLTNIVPDHGEKSLALIRHVASRGVIAGIGHTQATAAQVMDAVRAGSRYIVHMLNGPISSSYKPFNGGAAVEAALQSDDLCVELICDTYHVAPGYLRDVIARKQAQRVIAVTDQMFATMNDQIDRFNISGIEGQVSEDRQYVFVRNKADTLFSSVLTMDRAFCNLLNLLTLASPGVWTRLHEALDFPQALAAASAMTSTNAHRLTGDDAELGTIEKGKIADMVLLDIAGWPGQYRVTVKATFVAGKEVFTRLS